MQEYLPLPRSIPDLPRSTPEWILEEFKRFPMLATQQELLATLNDPKKRVGKKTWDAIRKHELKRLSASGKSAAVYSTSLLLPLSRFLNRGFKGFNGEAKLTITERRKIARDLQDAATDLEVALASFDKFEAPIDWAMSGGDYVASQLRPLLSELIKCADNWKTPRRAHVKRPSEATAARTFFMRTLSEGFKRRYGLPLNEATLDFTMHFFPETSPLDIAGVSRRLRPKRRKSLAPP